MTEELKILSEAIQDDCKDLKIFIPQMMINAELAIPNSLTVFCGLQFCKTHGNISIVNPEILCNYIGIHAQNVRKAHIENLNAVLDFFYANNIILNAAKFQDNRSAIIVRLNPVFFNGQTDKNIKVFFRVITQGEYMTLMTASLGVGKKYGFRALLLHYIYIKFLIYQGKVADERKSQSKQPRYAYISRGEIADGLGYNSSSTTSEICGLLKELGLIFFGKPMSAVVQGVFHNHKTIFVNTNNLLRPNYCWQQEYCNAFYHQFKKQLGNMTADERTYVTSQLPPEIKEYLDAKKAVAEIAADISDDELF